MKLTNQGAEEIITEVMSSVDNDIVIDVLVSFHDQDGTQHAQIAAECLQRVMPGTPAEMYKQVVTDVLRYYCDGIDLDV